MEFKELNGESSGSLNDGQGGFGAGFFFLPDPRNDVFSARGVALKNEYPSIRIPQNYFNGKSLKINSHYT